MTPQLMQSIQLLQIE
ncbi:hypothetical protein [Sinorhizobium meliloti]